MAEWFKGAVLKTAVILYFARLPLHIAGRNEAVEPASGVDSEPEAVSEQGENAEQNDDVQAEPPAERDEPEQDERRLIAATVAAE